jgi:hypothetical protein
MTIVFYLPLIIARGIVDVSAEAIRASDAYARTPAPKIARTLPGFDQSWLGANHARR